MKNIQINEKIPEDVHTEIGKYLSDRSLYNLLSSSKYNFNTQTIELKNRYQSLLDKYNRDEIVKKYCNISFIDSWYIDIFSIIKNMAIIYEKRMDTMKDLRNIIKLIQAGYDGYQKDMKDIIFILMPFSKKNPRLLYFLKKMLKYGILHPGVINIGGAYPIEHAVVYNNHDAVKILVENGNSLKYLTNTKLNLLILICKKNKYSLMYTYLVSLRRRLLLEKQTPSQNESININ